MARFDEIFLFAHYVPQLLGRRPMSKISVDILQNFDRVLVSSVEKQGFR
jgi:hypothetical protein